MFKPATLKNAYQDNVELEIHLSRKMYGRVLSPDRELSVDSAGVFSWKFSRFDRLPSQGRRQLDPATLGELTALVEELEIAAESENFVLGETDTCYTRLHISGPERGAYEAITDQSWPAKSWERNRTDFRPYQEYWSKEQVDRFYLLCVFFYRVEVVLGIDALLAQSGSDYTSG